MTIPTIKAFELEWVKPLEYCGPEENVYARMIGCVRILGVDFHVNLEQVHDVNHPAVVLGGHQVTGGVTTQDTVLPEDNTYAPDIWLLCDGAGVTVTIDDREYLLVISPFQR